MTRRQAIAALALAGAGCSTSQKYSAPIDPAEAAVDKAHDEVWKRFIDPRYFTFYDYAGLDGQIILPTPQECRAAKPNALAWWTPIENGAFFGGLYLDALCNRWAAREEKYVAERARKIAEGLVRLTACGRTPGFIARGVAADGSSHFPAGSDDQTFPWIYGMWRYIRSRLAKKQKGVETGMARYMSRICRTLMQYRWRMPCDDPRLGFRGSFAEFDYVHATRLLFMMRAMYDLSGDPQWLNLYRSHLMERSPVHGKTRLEILTDGALYEPPGPNYKARFPDNPAFWTTASCQAGLRGLWEMENDSGIRALFQRGLEVNAHAAAAHIGGFRQYNNDTTAVFDVDWRFLNEYWKPQMTIDEAVALARVQLPHWNKKSPKRRDESTHMREPLFAAYIATLAPDPAILHQHWPEISAAITHFDWSRLHTSLFFITENIFGEKLRAPL